MTLMDILKRFNKKIEWFIKNLNKTFFISHGVFTLFCHFSSEVDSFKNVANLKYFSMKANRKNLAFCTLPVWEVGMRRGSGEEAGMGLGGGGDNVVPRYVNCTKPSTLSMYV